MCFRLLIREEGLEGRTHWIHSCLLSIAVSGQRILCLGIYRFRSLQGRFLLVNEMLSNNHAIIVQNTVIDQPLVFDI